MPSSVWVVMNYGIKKERYFCYKVKGLKVYQRLSLLHFFSFKLTYKEILNVYIWLWLCIKTQTVFLNHQRQYMLFLRCVLCLNEIEIWWGMTVYTHAGARWSRQKFLMRTICLKSVFIPSVKLFRSRCKEAFFV